MSIKELVSITSHINHPCDYKWGSRPKGQIEPYTIEQFISLFIHYNPIYTAFNQIHDYQDFPNRNLTYIMSCRIFYYDDYCVVVESKDHIWKIAPCLHEDEEVHGSSIGRPEMNCYHYYKCKKCGKITEVDSSD